MCTPQALPAPLAPQLAAPRLLLWLVHGRRRCSALCHQYRASRESELKETGILSLTSFHALPCRPQRLQHAIRRCYGLACCSRMWPWLAGSKSERRTGGRMCVNPASSACTLKIESALQTQTAAALTDKCLHVVVHAYASQPAKRRCLCVINPRARLLPCSSGLS